MRKIRGISVSFFDFEGLAAEMGRYSSTVSGFGEETTMDSGFDSAPDMASDLIGEEDDDN